MPPPATAAPILEATAKTNSMRVSWTLPPGLVRLGSVAYVSLSIDGGDKWMRVDAATGKLNEPDPMPVTSATEVVIKEIYPEATYCAKIRLGGWGPDSAVSKALRLNDHLPAAPAAPLVSAVGVNSTRIHFTLPPSLPGAYAATDVTVCIKAGPNGRWQVVDAATSTIKNVGDATAMSWKASPGVANVKGLDAETTYYFKLKAGNACGWGPSSPESAGMRLKAHCPIAPAAPLAELVDDTSARIHFTLPPSLPGTYPTTHVEVFVKAGERQGSGQWQVVDSATNTIKDDGDASAKPWPQPMADASTRSKASEVQALLALMQAKAGTLPDPNIAGGVANVKGLAPNQTYYFRVAARNAIGWGLSSPESAGLKVPDSDVECTGERSVEEKNAELRKRAVDVESEAVAGRTASRIPAKRAKKE